MANRGVIVSSTNLLSARDCAISGRGMVWPGRPVFGQYASVTAREIVCKGDAGPERALTFDVAAVAFELARVSRIDCGRLHEGNDVDNRESRRAPAVRGDNGRGTSIDCRSKDGIAA